MKRISFLTTLAFPLLATLSSAASLTGNGYIFITSPGGWTPPNATSSDAEIQRFLWVPEKMAFRFGALTNSTINYWDAANLGFGSFSGGYGTKASGDYSFAFGDGARATGASSVALGLYSTASGDWSYAIGPDTIASNGGMVFGSGGQAVGSGSLVLGPGYASGPGSVAIGSSASASGDWSIAISTIDGAYATGTISIAIGNYTSSTGWSSLAIGDNVSSLADYSTALGFNAYTSSVASVALGSATVSNRMSGTAASPSSAQADDPVFMVSKGPLDPWTTPPTRNALTIYRNGASHFDGIVRVKPAGDVPMGTYMAKPSGVQYP